MATFLKLAGWTAVTLVVMALALMAVRNGLLLFGIPELSHLVKRVHFPEEFQYISWIVSPDSHAANAAAFVALGIYLGKGAKSLVQRVGIQAKNTLRA